MKQHIAIFYIALILLFKVGGLHAVSHMIDDTDDQHCEVCHITTSVSFIPLLATETPIVAETTYYFSEQKLNTTGSKVVLHNNHLSYSRFTRPPPHLV